MTPEHLEQCTSLHKMWSYFKPSLQPSLSNKETGVTSISIKATDTQINSTFFTYYSDRQPTNLRQYLNPRPYLVTQKNLCFRHWSKQALIH